MSTRKPPYSSARALDSFFEKIKTIGDPGTVDAKWAKAYGFEPNLAASIPTTLRWLGVIDESGNTTGVWNSLRPPATREEVLAPMVRTAYREVFDAIEVESASRELLEATFIHGYKTGDLGRPLTCFLTLCRHAGIKTAAEPASAGRNGQEGIRQPAATPRKKIAVDSAAERRRVVASGGRSGSRTPLGMAVMLSVEIPAEWSDDDIARRIATIKRILDGD
jgi:hypothetical protein